MPDGLAPLRLPELPTHVARPSRDGGGPDPWRRRAAWLVLAAHAVGVVVVDQALRLRDAPRVAPPAETVVEIRFLPPDPVEATPVASNPVVEAPATTRPAAPRTRQPPTAAPPRRDDGMAARFLPATPEPSIETRRLFDPDGRVRLPDGLADGSPPPARDPMAPPASPLPIERTRFDRAWRPDGETLGQEAVRRVPLLGILLPGVHGDPCPPNSEDPDCEAAPREQRARIPPPPQSGKQPW